MGYLSGLKEYMEATYDWSIFDQALSSGDLWTLHLHGHIAVQGKVVENLTYEIKVDIKNRGIEEIPKIRIKYLHLASMIASIQNLVTMNEEVKKLELQPIILPQDRNIIKNKSLFPLMQQQENVYFTLLEGEVLKAIIAGFSKYDITLILAQGIPVVILRHSIHDLRNEEGQCFLRSVQQTSRDWEKTEFFVP